MICSTPHKCQYQRKLCIECKEEHGDSQYIVSINQFKEMALKKLKKPNLRKASEITKTQRMAFQSMLSKTQSMLKTVWEDLSDSIKQIYERIDIENKSYIDLIEENENPAEFSHVKLESLVSILNGTTLKDLNDWNNSCFKELEKTKDKWELEINDFFKQQNEEMQKIQSLLKIKPGEVQIRKDDHYKMITFIQDFDESIFQKIIKILKKEKISDIQGFLSKSLNLYEQFIDKKEEISDIRKDFLDHPYFNDYSTETYDQQSEDLIKKVNGNIIEFLKFLVHVTSIDNQFIYPSLEKKHEENNLKQVIFTYQTPVDEFVLNRDNNIVYEDAAKVLFK